MINSIKITSYAFFMHLGISVIGTFVVIQFVGLFGGIDNMSMVLINSLHFLFISIIYIATGYFIATYMDPKTSIAVLFSPFLFGLILWLICYLDTPNSIDWKRGSGGIWLYYIMYSADYYTSLTSILRSFESLNNDNSQMYWSSTYSAIPSVFITIGTLIKRTLPNKINE